MYRLALPWLGPWIRDREVRVGLNGTMVVFSSLAAAVVAPLWTLALGPLVLGVPHLVADLRYLVMRPALHRRRGFWVVAGLLGVCAVTADLRWGLVAAAVAPLVVRGPRWRRVVAALPAVALLGAGWVAWRSTAAAFAHGHNAVAVVLWFGLAAAAAGGRSEGLRRGWWATPARLSPVLAFAVGVAAVLGGAFDGWLAHAPRHHLASLAPGVPAPFSTRLVVLFAFAQAVHYGLWLRVVPEEARHRPSPRSWKASLRALRDDMGAPVLLAAVVLTVAIAVWGLFDLFAARKGYLRLALFHGPMELAVLGVFAVRGPGVLRP